MRSWKKSQSGPLKQGRHQELVYKYLTSSYLKNPKREQTTVETKPLNPIFRPGQEKLLIPKYTIAPPYRASSHNITTPQPHPSHSTLTHILGPPHLAKKPSNRARVRHPISAAGSHNKAIRICIPPGKSKDLLDLRWMFSASFQVFGSERPRDRVKAARHLGS